MGNTVWRRRKKKEKKLITEKNSKENPKRTTGENMGIEKLKKGRKMHGNI